ncbi:hypothetical protein ACN38_g1480 [Penicillium nordicum]|uniref:Uncharacterized protein n=1 Tax=Penicillium nordicum TaxID=229535 RepID=A0A0M8PG83_9EURO|nr:hypothetical protein ACN38_g1480 [Penicillium nordicum]
MELSALLLFDREEVAVSHPYPNQTLLLNFFFKVPYLPNLYSSCLPAPATAAPASATPALALPALTKPPHWPAPPPSSSNTTHTRPGLPLLSN